MSDRSSWNKERIALSVRVGAMVAVLGFVLLAAEQRLVQDVSPQDAMTAGAAVSAPGAEAAKEPVAATAPAAPADYFPSHFPAPTAEDAQPPSTF